MNQGLPPSEASSGELVLRKPHLHGALRNDLPRQEGQVTRPNPTCVSVPDSYGHSHTLSGGCSGNGKASKGGMGLDGPSGCPPDPQNSMGSGQLWNRAWEFQVAGPEHLRVGRPSHSDRAEGKGELTEAGARWREEGDKEHWASWTCPGGSEPSDSCLPSYCCSQIPNI